MMKKICLPIDLVFTFDHAAFDALMGKNTFPLADYFTIEFSEGVDGMGKTNPLRYNPSDTVASA